jgi:hypothetical protein
MKIIYVSLMVLFLLVANVRANNHHSTGSSDASRPSASEDGSQLLDSFAFKNKSWMSVRLPAINVADFTKENTRRVYFQDGKADANYKRIDKSRPSASFSIYRNPETGEAKLDRGEVTLVVTDNGISEDAPQGHDKEACAYGYFYSSEGKLLAIVRLYSGSDKPITLGMMREAMGSYIKFGGVIEQDNENIHRHLRNFNPGFYGLESPVR